ncbi:3-phenylpropionate/trans-cinnamate dioxygenase ferredoxin reductase subunit [Spinactinospora alkalitolerans]|uniref:3-phenylpropionate/trans-cinnamate dioxygenase ferredoxin reductase subunit n=1 Tax=Spinactinospora alkalitolerans TaxID=687207 RepID=A0A852TVB9_9ACTN|nr:FAD-dependent oxidoreductase [Spinactinospora alkalitolerans]NYE47969.1 3-phenylpropionate/trans-cinnamate dioxygenase ferredoxin reductase subunit [Spinactinospora alkalitolerans]
MLETILIVGAGQTAAVAIRTLRRRGFDGRIILIGAEADLPYQRPPLSKEYLLGEQDRSELDLLPAQWCEHNGVETCTGAEVRRVDTGGGGVELSDGSRISGDAVLLATGGRPRRLSVDGDEHVHYLRTLADADRIRTLIRPDAHVIVVGAGFIGSELASSARTRGAAVTVLEQAACPFGNVVGPVIGDVCAAAQREHGVDLRTATTVTEVGRTSAGTFVRTGSGAVIEGDIVVAGVGMLPNAELARDSGIATDDGVLVDEYCRTSAANVFAAGDVARHHHPLFGRRMRVEHFDNASKQGMTAAKNILGRPTAYTDPHWFWSDQFGLNLQCIGRTSNADDIVIRGRLDAFDFTAFYLEEGVLRAAFTVERGGDVPLAGALITQQVRPDVDALRDEDHDLADLLTTA